MLVACDFRAFLDSQITGIPIYHFIIFSEQICCLGDVMLVCRCDGHRVNQTAACVYSDVAFHSEFPLIALFRLVHFRIPGFGCILGGAGSIDDVSTDGYERIVNGVDHAWEAEKGCQIIAHAAEKVFIDTIRLVSDSDLNRETYRDYGEEIRKFPIHCQLFTDEKELVLPKTLVRSFCVLGDQGDGEWKCIFSEENNIRRMVQVDVHGAYARMKLEFTETWGYDRIRIYGLDVC